MSLKTRSTERLEKMAVIKFKCKECGEIITEEKISKWTMNSGPYVIEGKSARIKHLLEHSFDCVEKEIKNGG